MAHIRLTVEHRLFIKIHIEEDWTVDRMTVDFPIRLYCTLYNFGRSSAHDVSSEDQNQAGPEQLLGNDQPRTNQRGSDINDCYWTFVLKVDTSLSLCNVCLLQTVFLPWKCRRLMFLGSSLTVAKQRIFNSNSPTFDEH